MPSKICPRILQILNHRFPQASRSKLNTVTPFSAAIVARTECTEDETRAKGLWLSKAIWLATGGGLFVAGLSAQSTDVYLFKDAYCDGGDTLSMDSGLSVSPLHRLQDHIQNYSDWARKRIFFRYERRVRAYSAPEKVFEYFASIKESKDKFYMTPVDLMRAMIPVMPPSESTKVRGGYLVGETSPGELHCEPSRFFSLFDTNSDGRISFEEYNFIRTLLITSLESFVATFKMFDRNGDGLVDQMEFQKVMHLMRERNNERIIRSGGLLPTRRSLGSSENVNLLKYLFGNDGKRVLQYQDFMRFLEELHSEILRLEFSHYDCKQQGSILAEDFGSSMVAAASMSNIGRYLRRVDLLAKEPLFKGVRISYKDFEEFGKLRKQRKLLALSAYAVDGLQGFTKQDFRWATSQVCQVDLSDAAVDIIFYIFDSNGDGKLSMMEFLGVQDLREISGVDPLQPGFIRMLRCMWNCTKGNCEPWSGG